MDQVHQHQQLDDANQGENITKSKIEETNVKTGKNESKTPNVVSLV